MLGQFNWTQKDNTIKGESTCGKYTAKAYSVDVSNSNNYWEYSIFHNGKEYIRNNHKDKIESLENLKRIIHNLISLRYAII